MAYRSYIYSRIVEVYKYVTQIQAFTAEFCYSLINLGDR